MLCAVTGFEDFQLVDTTRAVLYDVRRAEEGIGAISMWDSLARPALERAIAGEATSGPPLTREGSEVRTAFHPVIDKGRVVAVLVAEAHPEWAGELRRLGRRLTLVALVSLLAIAVLAGILVRGIGRTLALERQLTRADNLAAMGRMTATLAHEIKNPLAIIRGSTKRLGKLEPEAQRMADSVIEEVDRLGRTVGRYLQFARIEANPGETGDLANALGATLDLLEGEVRARGCVLDRAGDLASPAVVRLDLESLKQVCLNLVLNALEASPPGAGCASPSSVTAGARRCRCATRARAWRRMSSAGLASRSSRPRRGARGSDCSSRSGSSRAPVAGSPWPAAPAAARA